jgi:hypothetical protein
MNANDGPSIRDGDCDAALLAADFECATQEKEIVELLRFKKF